MYVYFYPYVYVHMCVVNVLVIADENKSTLKRKAFPDKQKSHKKRKLLNVCQSHVSIHFINVISFDLTRNWPPSKLNKLYLIKKKRLSPKFHIQKTVPKIPYPKNYSQNSISKIPYPKNYSQNSISKNSISISKNPYPKIPYPKIHIQKKKSINYR